MKSSQTSRHGFTLIELSIVLVIIGLIVGGVLVGQDLIKAAEIRATISQKEKYDAAVNTFRGKYNGLPGDLLYTDAAAFGLLSITNGGTGLGDGNGLVTDSNATNVNVPIGETLVFWRHLTQANLVDGTFGANIVAATGQLGASPVASEYFPLAKFGQGTYWLMGSNSGLNYYVLARVTGLTGGANNAATYALSTGISPITSYSIDAKLDDGMPYTGVVQARGPDAAVSGSGGTAVFAAISANNDPVGGNGTGATECVIGTNGTPAATDTYSRGTTAGNAANCNLRLRTSF